MPLNASKLLPLIALFPLMSTAREVSCHEPPSSMRAARIHAAGGPEALRIESVPVPVPAAGEVLVRVHYASVNPVDWKLQERGRLPFPATPGGDFSGEVIAVGSRVTDFACGDLVAGIVDQGERAGSYAEYLTVPDDRDRAKARRLHDGRSGRVSDGGRGGMALPDPGC